MSNSIDADETMSRLICTCAVCKKPIVIACGSERVEVLRCLNVSGKLLKIC